MLMLKTKLDEVLEIQNNHGKGKCYQPQRMRRQIVTTMYNITIENMFWARVRLILARATTINITLEGIEKIKTKHSEE